MVAWQCLLLVYPFFSLLLSLLVMVVVVVCYWREGSDGGE